MSDDEEDKAFYARADAPRSPTSPAYGPTGPHAEATDHAVAVVFNDDMDDAAAAYSSSPEPDEPPWLADFDYEDDPPDPAGAQLQSTKFAEYALQHYNADPNNGVKYELVEATRSNYLFVGYGHVNFVARPSGCGEERLFFAEVHRQLGRDTMVPTCLLSLGTEDDRVGSVAVDPAMSSISPWDDDGHVGGQYCFSCGDELKHPKDGTCYKAGHY